MMTARTVDNVRARGRRGNGQWNPTTHRAGGRNGSACLPEEQQTHRRDQEDGEEHEEVEDRRTAGEARGPEQAAARIEGLVRALCGRRAVGKALGQTALRAMKW
jgi:hypothetical protein